MIQRPNPKIFMGIAGLTGLVGMGLVYFAYSGLQSEEGQVETLTKSAQDYKTVQAQLVNAQKELTDCKNDLIHLEVGIPDHAYIPTLLADLEKVGNSNGIKVTGVKPLIKPVVAKKEGERKKPYDEVNIEVKGNGKYDNVRKFIAALNRFPKIVAARTVSLSPKAISGKDWSDQLEVVVELRGFVFHVDEKEAKNISLPELKDVKQDPMAGSKPEPEKADKPAAPKPEATSNG